MSDARKTITKQVAKKIWIQAQRLTTPAPFGDSIDATTRAVEHLGYVQIDTINVIERCHHHILFNRIPTYRRTDLTYAQTEAKTIFETWTHALSYVPVRDFRFFIHRMNEYRHDTEHWFGRTTPEEIRRVLKTIEREGAITIRDMNDEVLIEKTHPWASKKPSKKALEVAFHGGQVVVSERIGMLKRYELTKRHFGWDKLPKATTEKERLNYRLDRALRTQGFVSLDSVAYLEPSAKPLFEKLIATRVKAELLVEIAIGGVSYWMEPEQLEQPTMDATLTHLLSPFDPLVIQRKRLAKIFDYEHRFEAYLPKEKRKYGYFALPVLMDDEIVAALDLKTDRQKQKLLVQKWSWIRKFKSPERKLRIEEALSRFEKFQLQP
jgi:uncharacterized protein YcaQ